MIRIFTLLFAILFLSTSAKAEGINFRDITLEEALAQAADENKLVFIDCYTPTCGPCKFMADKIFPLDECGEFINPRFVSIKKDLVAPENVYIAERYGVRIYPTFIFLHPDGSIFYLQEGGATRTADKFLGMMNRIMTIGNSAIEWKNGRRDTPFMIKYIRALKDFNEVAMRGVLDLFITSTPADTLAQTDLWDTITQSINAADSPAFYDIIGRRSELSRAMVFIFPDLLATLLAFRDTGKDITRYDISFFSTLFRDERVPVIEIDCIVTRDADAKRRLLYNGFDRLFFRHRYAHYTAAIIDSENSLNRRGREFSANHLIAHKYPYGNI